MGRNVALTLDFFVVVDLRGLFIYVVVVSLYNRENDYVRIEIDCVVVVSVVSFYSQGK